MKCFLPQTILSLFSARVLVSMSVGLMKPNVK